MAIKRYLVVHPKLIMGEPLKQGQEIDADEDYVKSLIASGKIKLVVAENQEKKLTHAIKSKRQRSSRNKTK